MVKIQYFKCARESASIVDKARLDELEVCLDEVCSVVSALMVPESTQRRAKALKSELASLQNRTTEITVNEIMYGA